MNANAIALDALKDLYRGYVNTLENGRDRILSLGGQCDPLDKMEASDPWLISARAVIAEHTAKVLEDVEPVAWLDTVIDWTATGQPITRRICIQAQCGDWALSYIESALRETATTVAALRAEIERLRAATKGQP